MSQSLIFTKTICIPQGWDDALWQRAVVFWQERGFQFGGRYGEQQRGKRGGLWGNLFSFDPMKLRTEMTITRIDLTNLKFMMEIKTTRGQTIFEWNEYHWNFEMETLETWLMEGDKREEEWQAFNLRCRRANMNFIPWYCSHVGKKCHRNGNNLRLLQS